MKIEEELRSNSFKSDFHKAMVNLYFSYKWFENNIDEVFREHDLLSQHFNVLRIVKGQKGPCAVKNIRDVIMDKGRDLTRLIDKLEKRGYLNRELNPNNRREMLISLTKEGLEVVDIMDDRLMKKIESLKSLTETESKTLNDLLDKLRT